MLALRRRFRPCGDDDGFSLLEAVIAMAIATIVFGALSAAMISSMKAVLVGRSNQMSADVAQKELEAVRALGYDAIAMRDADLAVNDPLDLTPSDRYDPVKNVKSSTGEKLMLDPAGAVNPHVTTQNVNNTAYTVRKYVTLPEDTTGAATKRITVAISWTQRGETRTRVVSTLVTQTRRGLPLPDYKFVNKGASAVCIGTTTTSPAVFGFTLTNNGARDSWALSATGGTFTWTYYLDDGPLSPGAFDVSEDTLVPSVAGVPTVGSIDPTQSVAFWAVANVASSVPSTSTITFRATSVAQPTYYTDLANTLQVATLCTGTPTPTGTATATASATPTPTPTATDPASTALPTVSYPNCVAAANSLPAYETSGVTPRTYYLHNGSTNAGNTVAQSGMSFDTTQPSAATLWNYSTDLSSGTGGRLINATSAATFEHKFGAETKLKKKGMLMLWAAPLDGSSTTDLNITVKVQRLDSGGTERDAWTVVHDTNKPTWECAGYKQFGVQVDFGSSATKWLDTDLFRVTVTADKNALLAYDTTTYQSSFILPVA